MMASTRQALGLAAAACLALAAGCAQQVGGIAMPEAVLPAGEESPAFLDRVASGGDVDENDALRGMLMLLDGKDSAATFGERAAELRKRGIVPTAWGLAADRPLTRGRLALMACQAGNVPGGAVLTLTGPSQRYCLKELQYRGIMTGGAAASPVTGMEFVAVIARIDEFRQTGRLSEGLSPIGGD